MRQHGIQGRMSRRRHRTTIPHPAAQAVPDLLRRNFTAPAPDRAWIGDITYLPLAGGSFLYPATVIDGFSRRLLGWSMADHIRAELVTDTLNAAIRTRGGQVDELEKPVDQLRRNTAGQRPDLTVKISDVHGTAPWRTALTCLRSGREHRERPAQRR